MTMRYAIFSDIHANLEALEAVLAKIDELTQEEPIDQIWFLGDLVGYGPDPNECILKLREHTDVMIAGNHDWAAVGKIDLEDFSAAARISAEWTAEQLTEEHRAFLTNLAERSFQYFSSRYCLVGHTHVPVIFQQPDSFSNAPTLPLQSDEPATALPQSNGIEHHANGNDDETAEIVAVQQSTLSTKIAGSAGSTFKEPESSLTDVEEESNTLLETEVMAAEDQSAASPTQTTSQDMDTSITEATYDLESGEIITSDSEGATEEETDITQSVVILHDEDTTQEADAQSDEIIAQDIATPIDAEQGDDDDAMNSDDVEKNDELTLEPIKVGIEDPPSSEIEELLTLLGLSQSMIQVTNEMITPPEGH